MVTVDDTAGAIGVTGMQFAADGYRVEGNSIALQGTGGATTIRVGDGSSAGAGMTADHRFGTDRGFGPLEERPRRADPYGRQQLYWWHAGR